LQHESFEHFLDEGLVERHLKPLKHGKEASVHLFRANPRTTGEDLVALKLYHPLDRRDFRDESVYRDGEFIKERRVRTALAQKTKFGREVQGGLWVSREWETLRTLFADGAPVPRPARCPLSPTAPRSALLSPCDPRHRGATWAPQVRRVDLPP